MKACRGFAVLVMLASVCHAQRTYTLNDLQGAWWSDPASPTADFAISNEQVWLDFDAGYHPCSIRNGDVLVFELGDEPGDVKHRIVSLDATILVLENLATRETAAYRRND